MRRTALLAFLALVILGCDYDPETGRRFQAGRDLWNLNQEVRRLSIRPDLVTQAQWKESAQDYEQLAETYRNHRDTPAGEDVGHIAARALISAAELYAAAGDSSAMTNTYIRVEEEYADLPAISAEASLARGRLAERKGRIQEAVASYQTVVDRVEPHSEEPGIRGAVLELPLRIARLQARARGDTTVAAYSDLYEQPLAYYRKWAEAGSTELTRLNALGFLADAFADLGDWPGAVDRLRRMEAELLEMEKPPKPPSAVRFGTAAAMFRGGAPFESTLASFGSVLSDYPDSPSAPQALFAMAEISLRNGRTEDALRYLRRIREEFDTMEDLASRSLLLEAQILDGAGRWSEAHDVLRSLPIQHPLSEAALISPIEIVKHYRRTGDAEGEKSALERAETFYRDFVARYPAGGATLSAREKLAGVLTEQERYEDAVEEFLKLAELRRNSPQGARYLVAAAAITMNQLNDSERTVEILERTSGRYPNNPVGKWAADQAAQIREGDSP